MKKSLISILVFALVLSLSLVVYAATFSDVKGHWAEASIARWTQEGIIEGFDGKFRPDDFITRSEFVTIIMRIFEPEKSADIKSYKDIDKDAWYYDALARAVGMKALQGDPDVTMRPDDFITRQEAVVILNRIAELKATKNASLDKFSDKDEVASWAKESMLVFEERGYIVGYEDATVRPTRNITRAETVKLLDKFVSAIITKAGTYDLNKENGIVVVKAKNVVLKNTDDVARIFAWNNDVRDTLTPTVDDKDIINLSEKKEEEKTSSGGGGGSTKQETLTITLTKEANSNVFAITKEGPVKNGVKLIVKVVDEEGNEEEIINDTFSKTKFSALKEKVLNFIRENKKTRSDDAERLIRTAYEQYYLTGKKDACITLINKVLDSDDVQITEAERAKIRELRDEYIGGKTARQIYRENFETYKGRVLQAYAAITFDNAKELLEII